MTRPSPTQLAIAGELLAYEEAVGRKGDAATSAAGRVYDKLNAHLAPLLGAAGVFALMARSVKLAAQVEFADFAEAPALEATSQLREWFEMEDPVIVAKPASVVIGTFVALLATFIGERLTTQLLVRAWPTLEFAPRSEAK